MYSLKSSCISLSVIQMLYSVWMCGNVDRFIFETEKHNGIAELLEILGRLVVVTHSLSGSIWTAFTDSVFVMYLSEWQNRG